MRSLTDDQHFELKNAKRAHFGSAYICRNANCMALPRPIRIEPGECPFCHATLEKDNGVFHYHEIKKGMWPFRKSQWVIQFNGVDGLTQEKMEEFRNMIREPSLNI